MRADSIQIDRLLARGLLVLPLHRPAARSLCFVLHKPASAGGNRLAQWEHDIHLPEGDIRCDAPCGTLHKRADSWEFCVHASSPDEPGPGDFCCESADLITAVDAILDYYFGDPAAMSAADIGA